jgi:hypothetical protein
MNEIFIRGLGRAFRAFERMVESAPHVHSTDRRLPWALDLIGSVVAGRQVTYLSIADQERLGLLAS